jgi:hypothetical protein
VFTSDGTYYLLTWPFLWAFIRSLGRSAEGAKLYKIGWGGWDGQHGNGAYKGLCLLLCIVIFVGFVCFCCRRYHIILPFWTGADSKGNGRFVLGLRTLMGSVGVNRFLVEGLAMWYTTQRNE